jgi:biotin operon repressor
MQIRLSDFEDPKYTESSNTLVHLMRIGYHYPSLRVYGLLSDYWQLELPTTSVSHLAKVLKMSRTAFKGCLKRLLASGLISGSVAQGWAYEPLPDDLRAEIEAHYRKVRGAQ